MNNQGKEQVEWPKELVGICTYPAGEQSWWPADSTDERCPDCGECEPSFYRPASNIEPLLAALEEIAQARCNVHLIQGHMFPDADPRRIAQAALANLKGAKS